MVTLAVSGLSLKIILSVVLVLIIISLFIKVIGKIIKIILTIAGIAVAGYLVYSFIKGFQSEELVQFLFTRLLL